MFCVAARPATAPAVPLRQATAADPCARPAPGAVVADPEALHSHNHVLKVELSIRNHLERDGTIHYCYLTPDGVQSPTLRVEAGDTLILKLRDALQDFPLFTASRTTAALQSTDPGVCSVGRKPDPCSRAAMSAVSTNLHFHGLTVRPICHQDDVVGTSVLPRDPVFEYRIRIPADQPPGLYWYHPHIHGFSSSEVSGGASGALIVEGTERFQPELAGLPERVLVLRDMELLHPDALPAVNEPITPYAVESDGEVVNTGTGHGKPARDLSLNYVPVPFPDYPPAAILMRPGQRQLWRVLNASAITYLNLAVLYQTVPQSFGVISIDGVPLHYGGSTGPTVKWVDHYALPPGARVEFLIDPPPEGVAGQLVTRSVDTGPGGENDPIRQLATIAATAAATEPAVRMSLHPSPPSTPAVPWIGDVAPQRTRRLYFSEEPQDPNDANSKTIFYLTVDGEKPQAFDPASGKPHIVVRQGDVEDWIIENRSNELHAFHIHQLHFELRSWFGVEVDEEFLRDTINVPYYNGRDPVYPSVRLRMDFRDPQIVGTFVYHCHLLEHEDGGMMGLITVRRAGSTGRLARATR